MKNVLMMDCADGQSRAHNGAKFPFPVVHKTAAATLGAAETGKMYTNKGATGAIILTLPASPKDGLRFYFAVIAAQTLTVKAQGTSKINNSAAAGTYAAAGTQAGFGHAEVFSLENNWYVSGAGTWTTT